MAEGLSSTLSAQHVTWTSVWQPDMSAADMSVSAALAIAYDRLHLEEQADGLHAMYNSERSHM
jgi:hypothetical protein